MRRATLALGMVLAASAVGAQPPADPGDVRSLEGVEETQIEGRARTDVPGTVTDVDPRGGVVTVRAAGADLRLEVPAARAADLRPGMPVTVEVVLVARPPAAGMPGGGPPPANEAAPGREVQTPSGSGEQRVHPDMIGPRPAR